MSVARGAARRRQRAQKRGRSNQIVIWAGGIIVLAVIALVVYKAVSSSSTPSGSDTGPLDPSLAQTLASVPASVENAVGKGSVSALPTPADGSPLVGADNKPEVMYIGAEFCPYCAAERWGMIVALDRFGTFTGISTARSSGTDVFPSTPTFTFHGATYQSQYVDFSSVETENSQQQPLETPTAQQNQVAQKYDAPPYVPSNGAGTIPFIDFGNQYIISGSSYSPGAINGKSWATIASALSDPNADSTKGIVGTANVITATICKMTGDQPSDVCSQPAITAIEASLPASGASSGG